MEWGGGGGTRNGDQEAFRRPSGSSGQGGRRGEGERGNHENTLPFVERVMRQVRLYKERGRGGWGGDRDGYTNIKGNQERLSLVP